MTERRLDRRIATVLEATWKGVSGAQPCRVTDISSGGCFVQSTVAPVVEAETSVAITLGGGTISLRGRVLYVEPRMGFCIRFDEMSHGQADVMAAISGEPAGQPA
jgi:hypothetical protein